MIETKLLAALLLAATLTGGGYLAFEKVKNIGYEEYKVLCDKRFADHKEATDKRIEALETTSNTLVIENRENSALLAKDVAQLLKGVKGKTLTIVKDGGCTPTATFADTYNSVNKRVNQSMKDKQK